MALKCKFKYMKFVREVVIIWAHNSLEAVRKSKIKQCHNMYMEAQEGEEV
jgi:hypothetical protein